MLVAQRSFEVTAAAPRAELSRENTGEVAVTVTNRSGRAVKGRLAVRPQAPADPAWFAIDGTTRNFAPGAAEQVLVRIAVPPGTAAGSYSFHLDAWNEALPDEDFTEGQPVQFEIAPAEKPKPFPWWIVAVAAAVVIGIVVTIVLVTRDDDPPAPALPAPGLSGPPDGKVFARGEQVAFAWTPSPGAERYRLELERCPAECNDANSEPVAVQETAATNGAMRLDRLDFGRWRVVAIRGATETPSEFRRLTRLQPPPRPELLDPPDHAGFNFGDTVRFAWTESRGADRYRVEVDGCRGGPCPLDGDAERISNIDVAGQTVAEHRLGFGFDFLRWRVVAIRGGESSASEYRRLRCSAGWFHGCTM